MSINQSRVTTHNRSIMDKHDVSLTYLHAMEKKKQNMLSTYRDNNFNLSSGSDSFDDHTTGLVSGFKTANANPSIS